MKSNATSRSGGSGQTIDGRECKRDCDEARLRALGGRYARSALPGARSCGRRSDAVPRHDRRGPREGSAGRAVDRTIAAVAAEHDGVYSPTAHRARDRSASDEHITAHVRRLEALRGRGLVERTPEGEWKVSQDYVIAPRATRLISALGRRLVLLSSPGDRSINCRAPGRFRPR